MTIKAVWATGSVISINTTITGGVNVRRDGQTSVIPAVAQYSGYAVGDRVTLLLLGQQIYATGRVL